MSIRETFGAACRDTRIQLDLTQQQVADALGVHRGHLANIEAGRANLSVDLLEQIARTLGMRPELTIHAPRFLASPRRHDTVHAWCSGYVARRLDRPGWSVAREVDVSDGRIHGWIDLLAFERVAQTLVIIEIKGRLDDFGGVERQLGWYERRAVAAARQLGWHPARTISWLVALSSDEVDEAIRTNRDAVDQAFPGRADEMLGLVAGTPAIARRAIALVDPASRRAGWLIRTRLDGRRSRPAYRDYADAARRVPRRRR